MANPTPRFKANPIELAIFAVVSVIFLGSVYNLIYNHSDFHPAVLTQMAANPTSEGRSPASVGSTFLNLDVSCGAASRPSTTSASKVRLLGAICGPSESQSRGDLLKAVVTNTSGDFKFNAAVFPDASAGKFSTEYIPLSAGKNILHVEFDYAEGQTFSQDLEVTKN